MSDIVIMSFSLIGALFILFAAIGIVRMPDFYLRLSVTTKAATLGIGLILIGAGIYFKELSIVSRVSAIILFLLLTAPVAAHMIGRTSYFIGTKLWKRSVIDELEGKYNTSTHELMSNNDKQENEIKEDNIKEDPLPGT